MKKPNRSRMVGGLGATALALALVLSPLHEAHAEYPEKPIEWIVMWSAGGGADTATRTFVKYFEQEIGVDVNVKNVTGAGGSIGYLTAKRAKPDGYTLVSALSDLPKYVPLGTESIKVDDYEILGSFAVEAPIIVTQADAPWESIEDFEERARANPGELTIGVSNIGGVHHQPVALWMEEAGFDAKVVAHKGSPQMNAALLGGHVDLISSWVKQSLSHVQSGDLRYMAYFGSEPPAEFQDVPTFKELGYDIVWEHSYGMGAPKGIPEEAKRKLVAAMQRVWENPDFERDLRKVGLSLFTMGPDEYRGQLLSVQKDMERIVEILER